MALRSTELMIGDWVRVTDACTGKSTPCKITSIWENEYVTLDGDINAADLPTNLLEPIPLTPEILEKNGFNDDGEGVYGDDDSFFIPTYQSGFDTGTWETHIEPTEGIGDFHGKLRYVYELQHTLRFCGINKEINI